MTPESGHPLWKKKGIYTNYQFCQRSVFFLFTNLDATSEILGFACSMLEKNDDTHIPQPVVFMVIYHGRISKKPPQTNPSEIRRISLARPKVSSKTAKRRKLHPKPMAHSVDSSEIRNNHLQSGPKNIPKPVASTVK